MSQIGGGSPQAGAAVPAVVPRQHAAEPPDPHAREDVVLHGELIDVDEIYGLNVVSALPSGAVPDAGAQFRHVLFSDPMAQDLHEDLGFVGVVRQKEPLPPPPDSVGYLFEDSLDGFVRGNGRPGVGFHINRETFVGRLRRLWERQRKSRSGKRGQECSHRGSTAEEDRGVFYST